MEVIEDDVGEEGGWRPAQGVSLLHLCAQETGRAANVRVVQTSRQGAKGLKGRDHTEQPQEKKKKAEQDIKEARERAQHEAQLIVKSAKEVGKKEAEEKWGQIIAEAKQRVDQGTNEAIEKARKKGEMRRPRL